MKRVRDPEHLARMRRLPCSQCGVTPAGEAHHKMGAGMGLRASDYDAMPLCHTCHMALHALSGPFKGMSKGERRAWEENALASLRGPLSDDWLPA